MNFQPNLSIDPQEVEQFSRIADEWWDETGKFKPLHKINPIRISYLRTQIAEHYQRDTTQAEPFADLSLIDIGCGGGLISEPMARLGANVSGLDASERNIKTASVHAAENNLDIDYMCSSAEALAETGKQYDVVLALEIIEHVANVPVFIEAISKLVKPGGILVITTINRTFKSYALAIIGAEYIMRWVPQGTHQWKKFLRPSEIEHYTRQHNVKLTDMQGMVFSPLSNSWSLTPNDVDVNYLMSFHKKG